MGVTIIGGGASSPRYLVASGTDTYTGTYSGYNAYGVGDTFDVIFTNANTGAATLNINSLGAIALKKNGTTALVAGDIPAGSIHTLVYDGTNFQVLPVSAAGSVASNLYLFNNYI